MTQLTGFEISSVLTTRLISTSIIHLGFAIRANRGRDETDDDDHRKTHETYRDPIRQIPLQIKFRRLVCHLIRSKAILRFSFRRGHLQNGAL
jgi:hypothetical protein